MIVILEPEILVDFLERVAEALDRENEPVSPLLQETYDHLADLQTLLQTDDPRRDKPADADRA